MKKKLKALAGFTLAELLIVVAIIAVLVAISIPIFTSKLEASRESTDAANLRAAYSAAATALLTGKDDEGHELDFGDGGGTPIKCYYSKGGKLVPSNTAPTKTQGMRGKSVINGWQGTELTDLPEGVLLQHDATYGTLPDEDDDAIGNSKNGVICVILNNAPDEEEGEHEIEVYFCTPSTTTTPETTP